MDFLPFEPASFCKEISLLLDVRLINKHYHPQHLGSQAQESVCKEVSYTDEFAGHRTQEQPLQTEPLYCFTDDAVEEVCTCSVKNFFQNIFKLQSFQT